LRGHFDAGKEREMGGEGEGRKGMGIDTFLVTALVAVAWRGRKV